jgi:uncharacterized protein (TIGR02246 family)
MIESDAEAVRALYRSVIDGWNDRDAAAMARHFAPHVHMIGFDGSEVTGSDRAREYVAAIFANHKVASFVSLVREVQEVAPGVAILHAHAGMLPPGQATINPAVNVVQTLVAVKHDAAWRIVLFQNTPAAWHGREDDVKALTAELQAEVDRLQGAGRPAP